MVYLESRGWERNADTPLYIPTLDTLDILTHIHRQKYSHITVSPLD